jgi:hypothetical protein
MRAKGWLIVFVAIVALAGCQGQSAAQVQQGTTAVAAKEAPAPAAQASVETLSWNRKPFADTPEDFHFAIVSDNAGGLRPGVFKDAMGKLNLLRPAFVMCVGDLVEGYAANANELRPMWNEFAREIEVLDAPFFGTVGNHDVSNDMMSAYVERRFGPLYYSFVYGDVLFIVLNAQDDPAREDAYRSGLGDAQVKWATKTLAGNASVRWTFVFLHQPLFVKKDYADAPGWDKVEAALASRPHTVFAGHWHEYARHEVNGHVYYRLSTTGGDSELGGAEKGQFDEIVWVTMTKDGPVFANLDLTGIYPDDVSTDQTTLAYEAIRNGSFLKPLSMVTDERPFTGAKTTLEITNETDFPLTVKAAFAKDGPVVAEPSEVEASVKPHASDSVIVSLAASKPVDSEGLEPVATEWSARYEVPGRKPIEGKGKSAVLVEGVHACPKAAAAITVDGNLADWAALPEKFTTPMQFTANEPLWQGPADDSARFGAAYDDKYLYLAFAVTDDRVVVDDEHNARQEDALTILVDARPAVDRAAPVKDWKQILAFVMSPGPAAGREQLGELLPEGSKAASVITPTGYNTEIAIPVALLDKAAGGQWKDFRLNVRLHDLDTHTEWNATQMWWRPAWDGPGNFAGSGTFSRE